MSHGFHSSLACSLIKCFGSYSPALRITVTVVLLFIFLKFSKTEKFPHHWNLEMILLGKNCLLKNVSITRNFHLRNSFFKTCYLLCLTYIYLCLLCHVWLSDIDPPHGEELEVIDEGLAYASDLVKLIRQEFGNYFTICVAGKFHCCCSAS